MMKVSIYCLVYNHGKYLKSALEGFVNQKTNFDYQILLMRFLNIFHDYTPDNI